MSSISMIHDNDEIHVIQHLSTEIHHKPLTTSSTTFPLNTSDTTVTQYGLAKLIVCPSPLGSEMKTFIKEVQFVRKVKHVKLKPPP